MLTKQPLLLEHIAASEVCNNQCLYVLGKSCLSRAVNEWTVCFVGNKSNCEARVMLPVQALLLSRAAALTLPAEVRRSFKALDVLGPCHVWFGGCETSALFRAPSAETRAS